MLRTFHCLWRDSLLREENAKMFSMLGTAAQPVSRRDRKWFIRVINEDRESGNDRALTFDQLKSFLGIP